MSQENIPPAQLTSFWQNYWLFFEEEYSKQPSSSDNLYRKYSAHVATVQALSVTVDDDVRRLLWLLTQIAEKKQHSKEAYQSTFMQYYDSSEETIRAEYNRLYSLSQPASARPQPVVIHSPAPLHFLSPVDFLSPDVLGAFEQLANDNDYQFIKITKDKYGNDRAQIWPEGDNQGFAINVFKDRMETFVTFDANGELTPNAKRNLQIMADAAMAAVNEKIQEWENDNGKPLPDDAKKAFKKMWANADPKSMAFLKGYYTKEGFGFDNASQPANKANTPPTPPPPPSVRPVAKPLSPPPPSIDDPTQAAYSENPALNMKR